MKRRNFLAGVGGTAIGGSALLGTGAFSRVESHRDVTIEVATDSDAYLGLGPGSSENGDNYVEEDDYGHVEIAIGDSGNDGEGVNSNSLTFFDNLLEICNQGKEDAEVYFEPTPLSDDSGAVAAFYTGEAQGSEGFSGAQPLAHEQENAFEVALGECEEVGLVVDTGGKLGLGGEKVDATEEDTIIDETVTITADVDLSDEPA